MATVLAVLCSGRKHGYTSGLLDAFVEGINCVSGVNAVVVHLWDYRFGPCRSCFHCIRSSNHGCAQKDAMGSEGELVQKVASANALFIADAVHFWGPSAMCHLFMERLYPFLWSGGLNGLPFASLSCASNQGMQLLATKEICKWAFGLGLLYVGGLPAHLAYYDRAKREATDLGQQLAEAALRDSQEGRRPHISDEQRFLSYQQAPWQPLDPYLQNLTNDTYDAECSVIADALRDSTFHHSDAVDLLRQALPSLAQALVLFKSGQIHEATRLLVKASSYWTHATWQEFLEEDVIGSGQPAAYRPLPEQSGEPD